VSPAHIEQVINSLPKPPAVEGLGGLERAWAPGRHWYLSVIAREAERHGLPVALADSVVMVESGYNPTVVGSVGEIGLMQVRPTTAAMLGFTGPQEALSHPETNIRYGVEYLAQAWRLAGRDLCRALMKYRAGHGTERMTPLSKEYCRRARAHLASIGSPLAEAPAPGPSAAAPASVVAAEASLLGPRISAEQQRQAALQRHLMQRYVQAVSAVGSGARIERRPRTPPAVARR
jgi:hypothetical protein